MFRVESQLELLTTTTGRFKEPLKIRLRGNLVDEPQVAPAQFKDTEPVSVGRVVGFCPTHRDLYLIKRERVKAEGEKATNLTWPRVAGKLIEKALSHAYEHYSNSEDASDLRSSPDKIIEAAQARLSEYVSKKKKDFQSLNKLANQRFHLPNEDLQRLLADSIALDLFYQQGALNYKRSPETASTKALNSVKMFPEWEPAAHLKLSKATPDFVVPKHRAIGDIKSGDWSDEYYLTAAGYALAYESVYATPIDLGVIYLVEIDPVLAGQARTVIFPLTDQVRQRFLDRRNDALLAVSKEGLIPRRLSKDSEKEHWCSRCGVRDECFKRDDEGTK